jgi:hypothetical protein
LKGIDEFEIGVTQNFKRKMNTVDEFFLIFGVLSAGAVDLEAKRLKFPVEIAETAGMRRATARARDDIPFFRNGLMGLGIARIEKKPRWGR